MSLPWVLWIFPLPVLSSAPFLGHLFICDHRDFPSVHVEQSHCLQLVFSLHSIKPTKIFSQCSSKATPVQSLNVNSTSTAESFTSPSSSSPLPTPQNLWKLKTHSPSQNSHPHEQLSSLHPARSHLHLNQSEP
ncbi:uncharacterized protein PODANS_2_520 [Podospora anserina S mat+]|uniref:Podospora anserina S mat+ genomic DNA chromosome 2, supercontig 2 n=1 Tax=Podospora anserina (strain S / ATCC MYA-4624 / DSM 980 / FGSC 10383) TaxID=515849 RepID=B2B496_PODAN|nr:uncharacterized protein PODANS_2_520 [Podospora anserina S mat+]CAP72620.1 unnamed protein product [Podospora anserina S mat+]CDP25015.1 Putative protein of unknown function [Podospora anserina S mat+]